MIVYEIKSIHCADVPEPLDQWAPASADNFYLAVQLDIGPAGDDRADIFSCVVTTPLALAARRTASGFVLEDRALIVVSHFDWPALYRHLTSIVEGCAGFDGVHVQWKLQRYFIWEYEDMEHDNE